MTDPLHQFQIHVIAPLFRIGGVQFNFTKASVFMLLIVALSQPRSGNIRVFAGPLIRTIQGFGTK